MSEQMNTVRLNTAALATSAGKTSGAADAWLLQYAPSRYVAFPLKACQEIIESPEVLTVPGIVEYGLGMIFWRNQWLPLIDLTGLLLGDEAPRSSDKPSHCLVIAYRTADDSIAYVAVALSFFPYLLQVSNSALCALPTDYDIWRRIASSCFRYQNRRVPIIDGSKLFDRKG